MLVRNVLFKQTKGGGFKPDLTTSKRKLSSFNITNGFLCGFSIIYLEKVPRKVHYKELKYQKLNGLLDQIDASLPIADQSDLFRQSESLSNDEIEILTTYSKDVEAAMVLRYLGPDRVKHILPRLLFGIADANWPDSGEISKLLIAVGEPLVPVIKESVKIDILDSIWMGNILSMVVSEFEPKVIYKLKSELMEILKIADKDCASIHAFELLKREQLIASSELTFHFDRLIKAYEFDEYEIERLKEINSA
jgi:hypothetical protein